MNSDLNNDKSQPGFADAFEALLLFGIIAGLIDASFIVNGRPLLASGFMATWQFFNSSAILTFLTGIPYLLILLFVIRALAKIRGWTYKSSLAILYFFTLLPVGLLVVWNIAEHFASGKPENFEYLSLFYFLFYFLLLIPAAWGISVWLSNVRLSTESHVYYGRFTGCLTGLALFLITVPVLQTRFPGGAAGSATSQIEALLIVLGPFVIALIFYPLISWIAGNLARKAKGIPLIVFWIVAGVFPFVPSLINGPSTTGSDPSGTSLTGRNSNVVLISIDTLRADDLGCYGSEITYSPNIDRISGGSLTFDNAVCPIPITGPSHMSMLTGLQPDERSGHGIMGNGRQLPVGIPTLATILDASGYKTGAVIGGSPLSRDACGLQRGFHYYNDIFVDNFRTRIFPGYVSSLTAMKIYRKVFSGAGAGIRWLKKPADIVVDQALDWLDDRPSEPFFLFLHFYDPHTPLSPPEPFDTMYSTEINIPEFQYRDRYPVSAEWEAEEPQWTDEIVAERRARYRGEITFTDREIGRFIDRGSEIGLWDNTLLIITADHGEAFDTRYLGHINRLYESTVHVPLIIRNPDLVENGIEGGRIGELVNVSDIYYTVLDFLEIDYPVTADEIHLDIEGAAGGWDHNLCRSATGFDTALNFGWDYIPMLTYGIPTRYETEVGRIFGFRYRDAKLIYAPSADGRLPEFQLFDLSADPRETTDTFGAIDWSEPGWPNVVENLKFWSRVQGRESASIDMDPSLREQLEALGYVGK